MKFLFLIIIYLATMPAALAIPIDKAGTVISSSKKIALYIGSFDPMHLGHQTIIDAIIQNNLADVVIVIPQNLTLHKPKATAYSTRLEMIESLYKNHPQVIYPSQETNAYHVRSGVFSFFSHMASGTLSITNIILSMLKKIAPEADLYNVTGTDIVEKAYMRYLNSLVFRGFKAHIVSVWTDAPESANVLLPEKIGSTPIKPLYLSGLPRISSSAIKKDLQKGIWPEVLSIEIKTVVTDQKLYGFQQSCEQIFK